VSDLGVSDAERVERAAKDLEALSAFLSHDLRAPLRAMEGFSRLAIETQGEKLDSEGRRMLGLVHDSARRLQETLARLLDFCLSDRAALEESDVDMSAMFNDVFAEITSDGVTPIPSFRVGDLPRAHGDAVLIRQVVRNLASNAVKYCRKNPKAEVVVEGDRRGMFVEYRVRDNGAGFDGAEAGRLFRLFQRLHRREDFEGSGVGLSLVRRIIERHGGVVHARGEKGRGAEFSFTLPVADVDVVFQ
jgi:signal transduction histidine kinase